MDTLREYWPVFAGGAVIQAWVVLRSRRTRRFPTRWIAPAALVAAFLALGLWVESFLATQLAYQTVGAGARVGVWDDLPRHVSRSWPPLAGVAVVLAALARHPASKRAVAVLVAVAGALLSWIVAMWLFDTNHGPLAFRVLVLPGGLGIVASVVGFAASTALWMAIARWIWRRPESSHRDDIVRNAGAARLH
jgi:hypothetical protein